MELYIRLAHATKNGLSLNFVKRFEELEIPDIVNALLESESELLIGLGAMIKAHTDEMLNCRKYLGG